jgi:hypothetical protein
MEKKILYAINEDYLIYFDMVKMQAQADITYGGNLFLLLSKEYGIHPYKVFDDSIKFRRSMTKKAKLNQLIIDYGGEFASKASASKVSPDADGLVAPVKIKQGSSSSNKSVGSVVRTDRLTKVAFLDKGDTKSSDSEKAKVIGQMLRKRQ